MDITKKNPEILEAKLTKLKGKNRQLKNNSWRLLFHLQHAVTREKISNEIKRVKGY